MNTNTKPNRPAKPGWKWENFGGVWVESRDFTLENEAEIVADFIAASRGEA